MIKAKSILKRTLAVVLALLTLLSTGIVSALAATVELAPTGAINIQSNTYIYFDNSVSKWNDAYFYVAVGNDTHTGIFKMSKISNTNLYYVKTSSEWSNASKMMVFGDESGTWSGGEFKLDNQKSGMTHYTNFFTGGWNLNDGNRTVLIPASSSNNCSLSVEYKGADTNSIKNAFNTTVYLKAYAKSSSGTTYALSSSAASSLSMTGYELTGDSSTTSSTVTGYNTSDKYTKGSKITLSATASSDYKFVGWSKESTGNNLLSSSSSYSSYYLDGTNVTIYALFEEVIKTHTLSATVTNQPIGGSVMLNGSEVSSVEVSPGQTATVTVTVPAGYTATVGGAVSAPTLQAGTYTLTTSAINSASTVTVAYTKLSYTVTVNKNFPDGADVTISKSAPNYGDKITITATVKDGYVFNGWANLTGGTYADGTSGTVSTIKVNVTDNVTIDLNLTALDDYTIDVTYDAGGTAHASKSPVYEGQTVTLTATPNKGYRFTGWEITSGSYTPTDVDLKNNPLTITPTGDITAKATFAPNSGTIIIAKGEGGTVTSEGTHVLYSTSYVESTATDTDSHRFITWSITGDEGTDYELVDCVATDNKIKIRILANNTEVTARATFAIKEYTVTFVNGQSNETISTATVTHGGEVTLPATAPEVKGYTFRNWNHDGKNITADTTIKAVYNPNTYTVALNQAEGGTATVSAKTVTYPGTVKLEATPASDDYMFTAWDIIGAYEIVNGNVNSTEFEIRPEANLTITPTFAEGTKLTVHSISDNNYNNLTLKEGSVTVIANKPQPNTTTINGVEWLTSEKVELTGNSPDVTALLAGEGSSVGANDIFIQLSNEWWGNDWTYNNNIYLYTVNSSNSSYIDNLSSVTNYKNYKPNQDSSIGSGTCIDPTKHIYRFSLTDTQISNATTYGFALMSKQAPDKLWEMCIAHFHYDSSNNYYTVSSSYTLRGDNTNYRGNEFTITKSSFSTSTGEIELESYLYNGNTWLGNTEVWIYDGANGVTVTLRSQLIKLLANNRIKSAYGTGENTGYTADTWEAFKSAYETALSVSGAKASTQEQINTAFANLNTTFANLKYDKTSEVTVTQTVAGGTVTIGATTISSINEIVEIPQNFTQQINVTAPTGYYVAFVYVNNNTIHQNGVESKITFNGACSFTEDEGNTVHVVYIPRAAFTVTVEPFDNHGSLTYNGSGSMNYEGGSFKIYNGDSIKIYAHPNEGYEVKGWTVNGKARSASNTLQLEKVSSNTTVTVTFGEIEYVDVAIMGVPNSVAQLTAKAGNETVTNTFGSNSLHIPKSTLVELSVDEITNGEYSFFGWTIKGEYSVIAGTGNLTTEKVTIRANDELEISAKFFKTKKYIYLKNDANWGDPYVYFWDSAETCPDYPGLDMKLVDGYYVAEIPIDAASVKFSDKNYGNNNSGDQTIGENNCFNNNTKSWSIYSENGYYIQGTWAGSNHTSLTEDLYMVQDINGNYYTTLTIDAATQTTNGYITTYVTYKNGTTQTKYAAGSSDKTDNPHNLTNVSSVNGKSKIFVGNDGKYYVTLYFDPSDNNKFWWEVEVAPETVIVYGNDGQTLAEVDSNSRLGDTYFDFETVIKTTESKYYSLAEVEKGKSVNFYTQVKANASGKYDYYVDGWVLNGNLYVDADPLTNGLYAGATVFTEPINTITPVYFHTDEWIAANGVNRVTVYAVNQNDDIENWNKYMSAYTWYSDSYHQFGKYTGQLMIPLTGTNGLYYTMVETTTPGGGTIQGITFNNHGDAKNGYDVSGDVLDYGDLNTHDHIQTYDYREFIVLNESGKNYITFVLKNTNDHYNNGDLQAPTNNTIKNKYNFVPYVDYSGLKTDIFGTNIEANYDSLDESKALYIIQTGNHNTYNDNTCDFNGEWVVKSHLYNANGTFIGECWSYELHESDSDIWKKLSGYAGQKVYISYETVNGGRYDGEWYGDANVNVTVNLAVNVAEMVNGVFTVNESVNTATFGNAYISKDELVNQQNINIKRNEKATISAMAGSGYKFVGWYSKDGKFFSSEIEYEVTAGIGTYYTAVFEELDDNTFVVNHYKYTANGATAEDYPLAHGGNALLYVGIKNNTLGTESAFTKANTATIYARENDELEITIGTDATGAHKFFAWYVDAINKHGLKTFEEVGVDTEENLANNKGSVVGRNDMVYFTFKYTVKDGDDFNITIYSDLENVTSTRKLTYKYTDRFDNVRTYIVEVQLTDDEITGFAGNEYKTFTPAYISGDTWDNTVLKNAPFVGDFYKNVSWNVMEFKPEGLELWASEAEKEYTITFKDGTDILVLEPGFNEVVEYEAAEGRGFWFDDTNHNSVYDEGVDRLLSYTNRYALRVTKSMTIIYHRTNEAFDFAITLDDPVYGRVQETDDNGANKTDKVQADFVINILTPFLYGYSDFEQWYDGKEVTENWNGSQVTVESLEKAGYKIKYGVVREQVASVAMKDAADYEEAQTIFGEALVTATGKGYGVKTDDTILDEIVLNNLSGVVREVNKVNHAFYLHDFTEKYKLTNMNRYQFYFEMDNTEGNWKRFYNIYAYVYVEDPKGNKEVYYSNVQQFNIYTEGQSDPSTTNSFDVL